MTPVLWEEETMSKQTQELARVRVKARKLVRAIERLMDETPDGFFLVRYARWKEDAQDIVKEADTQLRDAIYAGKGGA